MTKILLIAILILCFLFGFCPTSNRAQTPSADTEWRFAVSGDSRNCGDVVMPAIAQFAGQDHASFYWHLGDYRAIYDFDQDMRPNQSRPMTILEYHTRAWDDFIQNQINPFKIP